MKTSDVSMWPAWSVTSGKKTSPGEGHPWCPGLSRSSGTPSVGWRRAPRGTGHDSRGRTKRASTSCFFCEGVSPSRASQVGRNANVQLQKSHIQKAHLPMSLLASGLGVRMRNQSRQPRQPTSNGFIVLFSGREGTLCHCLVVESWKYYRFRPPLGQCISKLPLHMGCPEGTLASSCLWFSWISHGQFIENLKP